jgi:hypothetical protein
MIGWRRQERHPKPGLDAELPGEGRAGISGAHGSAQAVLMVPAIIPEAESK